MQIQRTDCWDIKKNNIWPNDANDASSVSEVFIKVPTIFMAVINTSETGDGTRAILKKLLLFFEGPCRLFTSVKGDHAAFFWPVEKRGGM